MYIWIERSGAGDRIGLCGDLAEMGEEEKKEVSEETHEKWG
jgi:hypothetical protein